MGETFLRSGRTNRAACCIGDFKSSCEFPYEVRLKPGQLQVFPRVSARTDATLVGSLIRVDSSAPKCLAILLGSAAGFPDDFSANIPPLFTNQTAKVSGIAGIARIHQIAQLDGMLCASEA